MNDDEKTKPIMTCLYCDGEAKIRNDEDILIDCPYCIEGKIDYQTFENQIKGTFTRWIQALTPAGGP